MLLHLLAVIIYLGIALIIYRGVLKKQDYRHLTKKDYTRTLISGALPCTICIIVLELLFDRLVFADCDTLLKEIIQAFARAALIEEACKYVFSKRAIKKSGPATRVEFMLLCGMIGAGYGLVEKLAYGGGIILIVNAVLPLHIFFQFLMGDMFFKSRKIKAFLLPFLVHGTWDSLLAVCGWLLDREGLALQSMGLVLMAAVIIGGVIAEIKIVKKMRDLNV